MQKPTIKQIRFIQQVISNGGNATEAAMFAYDTTDYATAKAIGSENLTKPYIRREIDRYFGRENVSVSEALQTIREALEAKGANGDGLSILNQQGGKGVSQIVEANPP